MDEERVTPIKDLIEKETGAAKTSSGISTSGWGTPRRQRLSKELCDELTKATGYVIDIPAAVELTGVSEEAKAHCIVIMRVNIIYKYTLIKE